MNEKELVVYKQIDQILWNDWDPIGVNDVAPRDEYRNYLPKIFRLKQEGADSEVIAQALYILERDSMGLAGNFERCRVIANKITNL